MSTHSICFHGNKKNVGTFGLTYLRLFCLFCFTYSARRFLRVLTIYVLSRNMKNIRIFYLKNFSFLMVKFSIYLNRRIFVMETGFVDIRSGEEHLNSKHAKRHMIRDYIVCNDIQSTLVISKSKGLPETLRGIHTSTYQICGTEEKNKSNCHS